jgi:hypothetical protein
MFCSETVLVAGSTIQTAGDPFAEVSAEADAATG